MESDHFETGTAMHSSDQSGTQPADEASVSSHPAAAEVSQQLNFQDSEVIRIELYEEVPTIHRKTVASEKVYIKKVINLDS
jgi:stress response protein YsnF